MAADARVQLVKKSWSRSASSLGHRRDYGPVASRRWTHRESLVTGSPVALARPGSALRWAPQKALATSGEPTAVHRVPGIGDFGRRRVSLI
jgi:hypothetical protein